MKRGSISNMGGVVAVWLVFLCLQSVVPARAASFFTRISDGDKAAMKPPQVAGPQIWKDPSQPIDARVQDLIRRMSLVEKVSQLRADSPAIPRLGIHKYSYRNECLHGVGRAGVATVFPQAIGMAATWDTPLIHQEAEAIAIEARAKYNDYAAHHHGDIKPHYGLSFFTPTINIVRDPRWGRGQETYGEDPFLTGRLAVAFIRGLQGDNPRYVEVMACAKHFAVHCGPEPGRNQFNARPPERDLYETYLPAFEAAVREGHVGSVMGAYSALYGTPDCANPFLLTEVLRQRWGFKGFVTSDGGAIANIWADHHFTPTLEKACAVAVQAGCNLCSGKQYDVMMRAVHQGLITEKEINAALYHDLKARFRLGIFDPPDRVPWSGLTLARNDTPEHRALALKVAQESIVLLKNDGLLPLARSRIKRIAVIGANAGSAPMLLGNYHGEPSRSTTILEGLKQIAGERINVTYEEGCPLALKDDNSNKPAPEMTRKAVAAAKAADVVIYVGGINASLEQEGNEGDTQGFLGGDRTRIELPPVQEALLKALEAAGKPIVYVNCSGSAMAIPWEDKHLPAIVQAWYPGEEGGRAVAEVLFGKVNPAGRLPVTFYRSTKDLPAFEDYSMANRTYRYFAGKPLYAFGHGLSYTSFNYAKARLGASTIGAKDSLKISFTVKNTGSRDGDEVAQVYFRHLHSAVAQPKQALCGFTRIHLAKGEAKTVSLDIPAQRFRYWDTTQKRYVVEPGQYELLIGAASDDIRLRAPFAVNKPLTSTRARGA